MEDDINIAFAVLGELYLGAYRSANPNKHIKQINAFLKLIINKSNALTHVFMNTKTVQDVLPLLIVLQ